MNRKQLAIGGISGVSLLSASSAMAAVPTEVTDALTALGTDVATVGTALVVAAAVAIGFKWIKAMLFGG